MSTTRYSTAFAHVVSAGVCIWAIRAIRTSQQTLNFPLGSFGTFLVNSALGILRFGNPEFGGKMKSVYGHTLFISKCVGLPCVATQMCLRYGIQEETAYIHLGCTTLPIIAHIFKDKREKKLLDMVMLFNLISAVYFSYLNVNHYGLAMAISYTINHFIIGTDSIAFDTSVPSLDLFMYGCCFFYFFAVRTLLD